MLSACLLSACTPGPERPAPPQINADAEFSAAFSGASTAGLPGKPWWRQAVTDTIWPSLELALSANPQLTEAQAEIDAARAQLSQAEADSGPSLDLGADYRARRESGDTTNSRSIGVDGSVPDMPANLSPHPCR